ncbi:MAG: hypothetical protein JSU04_02545 [Bdellovibrionales bacterium]|nr:hypothetical protein [Bdellovibrionales bacterium]
MFRGNKSYCHNRISGFSSLEMMVAIGILATIFILAMPFFSQQGKIVKQLRTSANCQAILDTAFARVNSFGNSLDGHQALVNPAMTLTTGANAATLLAYQIPAVQPNAYDPAFASQRATMYGLAPGGALYTENGPKNVLLPPDTAPVTQTIQHDGVTLYTPLLLKGSMEYLATKYNAGHCDAFAPVQLLTNTDSNALSSLFQGGLKDLRLSMKVSRYDIASNQLNGASCGTFWPRPRNGARSSIVYEPQFGNGVTAPRQIIGQFPAWIQDTDGFRVTMRAQYTNDKGQTEDCDGTKDFSLPEDKQNVSDYFYDVSYVKASPVDTSKIVDDYYRMRNGTVCNGGNCLGHPFETIYTNLQPYNAANPDWPENRDRPLCSQTPANNTSMVVSIRVYNTQKEPGLVPMCMDTSNQWFKNYSGNWCPGSYNGGAEQSFDKSWNMRYTGWVPCEHMQFCNSRPDRVEVVKSTGTNSKIPGAGVSGQPYVEYRYHYDNISGDKNNPRMWGCEMKFGVAMLDMAGNLSYVPAVEGIQADSYIAGDKRPPIKEINPHVYFKPPPCYTCNCKPCKGGKGLFGGLFNWFLFVVLVVVSGGLFGVIGAVIVGAMCLNGGLGCYSGGGTNYAPSTSGGKYRSCDDSNNGCKCGQKCNAIKPPAPPWSSPWIEGFDISKLEQNACAPGSTFYYNGAPMNSVGGMTPTLAYKVPKGTGGAGYDYMTNATTDKIQPGDEVMWSAFDAANSRFCYVATRCAQGKLQVIKESSEVPGDNNLYPLMGCSTVRTGKKIAFNNSQYGIAQGGNACLEVEFMTGPQNPSGTALWNWSKYNEQCSLTNSTGNISTDPRVVGGNCPQSSPIATNSMTAGATQMQNGPGCAKGTQDPNDPDTINFACKATKLYWDGCAAAGAKGASSSCYMWCYAECTVPTYIPEHPWVDDPNHKSQRYYEPMAAGDANLPFCTMDRKQFDAGF